MYEPEYSLAIVGDRGAGKTTFVSTLDCHWFKLPRSTMQGLTMQTVMLDTNYGSLYFRLCESSGPQPQDGLYANAQGVIVMLDLTSRISLRNVPRWVRQVRRVMPRVPIVIFGSKADVPGSFTVTESEIASLCDESLPYFSSSATEGWFYQYDAMSKVLEWFARSFIKECVSIIQVARDPPPETTWTAEQIAFIEAESAAASAAAPLPDEDDDL